MEAVRLHLILHFLFLFNINGLSLIAIHGFCPFLTWKTWWFLQISSNKHRILHCSWIILLLVLFIQYGQCYCQQTVMHALLSCDILLGSYNPVREFTELFCFLLLMETKQTVLTKSWGETKGDLLKAKKLWYKLSMEIWLTTKRDSFWLALLRAVLPCGRLATCPGQGFYPVSAYLDPEQADGWPLRSSCWISHSPCKNAKQMHFFSFRYTTQLNLIMLTFH